MAGIALHGSLTDVFPLVGPVALRHRLESVKFLPPHPGVNDPKDYGPFTMQAVAIAEIEAPERNRAICMAVTADDRDLGMPSLWSAAVDQLCSGATDDVRRLMFIPGSKSSSRRKVGLKVNGRQIYLGRYDSLEDAEAVAIMGRQTYMTHSLECEASALSSSRTSRETLSVSSSR
jgi:hypothetical protein